VVVIPPNSIWPVQAEVGEGLVLEQVSGAWKLKAPGTGSQTTERRDDWVAAAGQTTVTLSQTASGEPDIYRNGLLQRPGPDYSYDPPTRKITFAAALTAGDYLTARYRG
jgi:hypothetical protein